MIDNCWNVYSMYDCSPTRWDGLQASNLNYRECRLPNGRNSSRAVLEVALWILKLFPPEGGLRPERIQSAPPPGDRGVQKPHVRIGPEVQAEVVARKEGGPDGRGGENQTTVFRHIKFTHLYKGFLHITTRGNRSESWCTFKNKHSVLAVMFHMRQQEIKFYVSLGQRDLHRLIKKAAL